MKRFPFVLFLFALTILAPLTVLADLSSDIRMVLNDKLLSKGEVGIEVIHLGADGTDIRQIYEYKSTIPRIPASNLKLLATAAAMDKLGGDFEFKTMLARRGADVALIGDGDPTLGDVEMLRKLGWGVDTVFKAWAEALKSRGITEVHHVYVDDSIFDETFKHPDWPADQEHKRYVAQVGGVNLNANCVDFYLRAGAFDQVVDYRMEPATQYISLRNTCVTGGKNAVWLARQLLTNNVILRGETNASNEEPISVTVHDPSMFAATVLAETLAANGVRVTGQVRRDRTIRVSLTGGATTRPAERWNVLAVHATPLAPVLARANKDSMNLYADALCKRIGAAANGGNGSWENGTAALSAYLKSLDVDPSQYNLADGCGLSKKNMISPHAIAKVLQRKFQDRDQAVYLNSLAVGGIDGTLKDRFREPHLRGRVFGKSGYVAGVRSLSGYLKARDGQFYAFSILMNALPDGDGTAKQLQEKIVQAIDAASSGNVASGR